MKKLKVKCTFLKAQKFCYFSLIIFILNSCQTEIEKKSQKPKRNKQNDQLEKKNQELLAEMQLGRNMAGRLLQFYGTYGDQGLVKYVNKVGSYVAQFTGKIKYHFMFNILDTDEINAFACPGGYILITKGLLKELQTEAELAAILGHEIAHVNEQHMFDTLRKMNPKKRESEAKKLDEERKRLENRVDKFRRRPKAKGSTTASSLARYLTGTGVNIGFDLLKTSTVGMNVILNQGLSPKLEYEADKLGLTYASNAGYNPQAYKNFLSRLTIKKKVEKEKKLSNLINLGKTHPPPDKRLQALKEEIQKKNLNNTPGANGKERFLENKKNLN